MKAYIFLLSTDEPVNKLVFTFYVSRFTLLSFCTFFFYGSIFLSLKGVKHLCLLSTSVSSVPNLEFERVRKASTPKLTFHPFHPFQFFSLLHFIQVETPVEVKSNFAKCVKEVVRKQDRAISHLLVSNVISRLRSLMCSRYTLWHKFCSYQDRLKRRGKPVRYLTS